VTRPFLVNQQDAAKLLGLSVQTFNRLRHKDHRLMPAAIPETKHMERYLVSDLEEWARSVKYPTGGHTQNEEMWGDEGAA